MKSIESITVGPSRAESKESAKVESIDRVGQKLPWIDRLARLDRFRGLPNTAFKPALDELYKKHSVCTKIHLFRSKIEKFFQGRGIAPSPHSSPVGRQGRILRGPNRRPPKRRFVVSTRVLQSSQSTKINSGRGFAPNPTGGAYSAPLDP